MLNTSVFRLTAIAAVTSLILGCSQQSPDEQLAQAQQYLAQKSSNKALIEVKNVLKNDPQNAKARYVLGEIEFANGSWLNAVQQYQRALDGGYDRKEIIPHYAQALYRANELETLRTLESNSNELSANSRAIVKTFYALALIRVDDTDTSRMVLESIVKDDIDESYSQLSDAILSTVTDNTDTAIETLNQVINSQPDLIEAVEIRGHLHFYKGDFAAASKDFGAFSEFYRNDLQSRLIYAHALVLSSDFEKANEQLEILESSIKDHPLVQQLRAEVLFYEQNFTEAYGYANSAVQSGALSTPIARIIAGISAFENGNMEAAYTHLTAIKDQVPASHPAKRVLAIVQLNIGYTSDAVASLNVLREAQALNSDYMTTASLELYRLGRNNDANLLIREAQQAAPDNADIATLEGRFNAIQDPQAAISAFERAIELKPSWNEPKVALALEYAYINEFEKALVIAEDLKQSDEVQSLVLKGTIARMQKNTDGAQAYFEQALTLNAEHVGALSNLATLFKEREDWDTALDYFGKTLRVSTEHLESFAHLMDMSRYPEYNQKVTNLIISLYDEGNESAALTLALADTYRRTNQLDQAFKIVNEYLTRYPNSPKVLLMQGRLYQQAADHESAIESLDKVTRLTPNSIIAWIRKIGSYEALDQVAEALIASEQAIAALANPTAIYIIAAHLELKNDRPDIAGTHISEIPDTYAETEQVIRLKALLADAQGNSEQAATQYRKLYQKYPSAKAAADLSEHFRKQGNNTEALAVLDEFVSRTPQTIVSLEMKRARLYDDVDNAKVIEIYERIASPSNYHFAVMNNLAWAYIKDENFDKAMEYATKAMETGSHVIEIKDTFGTANVLAGNLKRGEEILAEVFFENENNPEFRVHYAYAVLQRGATDRAKQLISNVSAEQLSSYTAKLFKNIQDA